MAAAKKGAPPVSESVLAAAQSNDRRRALIANRDKLAKAMDDPMNGGVLPQLSAQFRAVLEELDALPTPGAAKTELEKMRERRQERQGA